MEADDQPAIDNQDPQFSILPTGDLTDSRAIMPSSTPARLESSQAVQISQMTPIACKCTVSLTPDDFYSLFTKLPPYNGVIFFETATREALFFRPETSDQFPNLIDDLDNRWYARVVDDTLSLKTFPPNEVFAICQSGPCFFFHGRPDGGNFKSRLSPTLTDAGTSISLPCFNADTKLWALQSR